MTLVLALLVLAAIAVALHTPPRVRSLRGHVLALSAKVRGTRALGRTLKLAASTSDGWWVLAYEGPIRGMELTKGDFEEVVANFQRFGREVPVTLYHADVDARANPESRKAHAWLTELRVGSLELGGKTVATLEAKKRWVNEATRADVESGALAFGSVFLVFNAVDEATDEEIGTYLYSFSLTNNPALTKLPALAADRVGLGYWYGTIITRGDVLSMLREVFDLPVTSTETDVLAALDKLSTMVAAPEDASGVDVDHLLCQLRDALRLPALTTSTEVIASVRSALQTLPSADADALSLDRGRAAAPHTETKTMKYLELAARYGIAATSEEDARSKILALAESGVGMLRALGLSLGATAAEVASRVSSAVTEAARVPALVQELEGYRKSAADARAAERGAHIEDVLKASGLPESVRPSLELHAAQDWDGFQKAYPRPSRAELAQRAQDAQRLGARRAPNGAAPLPLARKPEAHEPTADDLHQGALALMDEHAARGTRLSYGDALTELTARRADEDPDGDPGVGPEGDLAPEASA